MGGGRMKKDETRFTIRFNPVDPRQFRAMKVLEAAGRRKSTIIADAVCEYLERRGENDGAFALPIITAPVVATTHKNETSQEVSFAPIIEPIVKDGDENLTVASVETTSFDDEIHNAILDGLAAFDL
jgi:hypothetical protein